MATDSIVDRVEFEVPIRIISEMNAAQHWREVAKRKKDQQWEMKIAMLQAFRGKRIELPIHVKLTRYGQNLMDQGNFEPGFKHVQDQIAKRFNVDDGDRARVSWEYNQVALGKREYKLKVEISHRGT